MCTKIQELGLTLIISGGSVSDLEPSLDGKTRERARESSHMEQNTKSAEDDTPTGTDVDFDARDRDSSRPACIYENAYCWRHIFLIRLDRGQEQILKYCRRHQSSGMYNRVTIILPSDIQGNASRTSVWWFPRFHTALFKHSNCKPDLWRTFKRHKKLCWVRNASASHEQGWRVGCRGLDIPNSRPAAISSFPNLISLQPHPTLTQVLIFPMAGKHTQTCRIAGVPLTVGQLPKWSVLLNTQ